MDHFHEALTSLEEAGQIVKVEGVVLLAKDKDRIHCGTISIHTRGFGFVGDIFIPKHCIGTAVDGDKVCVLIEHESFSEKGPEGKVISVLERGRKHLAVTLTGRSGAGFSAHSTLLGQDRLIYATGENVHPGDRVILQISDWGTPIKGTVSSVIGSIKDPSKDVIAAIEEFSIRDKFPPEVIAEALHFGARVTLPKDRVDLSKLTTCTIDPDTARDFDDALSIERTEKGYTLWVHVADVSHYVKPGTALDEEARLRCNSTYLPGTCVPMLPEELSNELCSLKEDVVRLTATVEMHFNNAGVLQNSKTYKSTIRSCKRFTYREALAVLEGKKSSPLKGQLELMVELCHLLKKQRALRGSVELAMTDVVVLVDKQGVPKGFDRVEYDITHQLVEEFMLKANEVVAQTLTAREKVLPYRVHEKPSPDALKDFSVLAGGFGFRLPEAPSPDDLRRLFDEAAGTPFAAQLAVAFIRSQRLAFYSPSRIGHFGLSLEDYTHFTSPIRRYIDLVIHRLLFEECAEDIEVTAARCSQQERVSSKAESNVTLLKKLRWLEAQETKTYEGIITKVKQMGIIFDIPELMLDGFIHISEISNDYLVFHEGTQTLQGRYNGESFKLGQKITLQLDELNLITLESRWSMHGKKAREKRPSKREEPRPPKKGSSRKRRRR